jgi:cellulose synthase/poly-beta-1,6-N-acetylglucosamine synthase-like glycosyltransferase
MAPVGNLQHGCKGMAKQARNKISMDALGFVVIGRNEGGRLAECLRSLQVYGAPIIYADSASDDGSPELAEKTGAIVVRLDSSSPMNASRGRQEGFNTLLQHMPDCRYVQFIDGDCLLAPGWIQAALTFMAKQDKVAVVCGRRFEANPQASFYNRLCDEEWNTPCGKVDASGGDALMRTDPLRQVGGFDPTLMASEEPELAARLREAGWEIWRIDVPMTEHDARIFGYRAYWRRSLRGGFGLWQAWRRTAKLRNPINGRSLLSAFFWVAALPIATLVLATALQSSLLMLALPLLYLVQITRMAAREGVTRWHSWRSAIVIMSIKSAELIGAARALLWKQQHSAIDYKAS